MKSILQLWAEKVFWWIPTKDEQVTYREEELERIEREYPQVLLRMTEFGNEVITLQNKLLCTFSDEQEKIWWQLKTASQKQLFESNRLKHFEQRRAEIPQEIQDIISVKL